MSADTPNLVVALREARAIAADAGLVLMEGYRRRGVIRKKGPADLVTDFDVRSEELIRSRLRLAFPSHVIVGEEGGSEGGNVTDESFVWYVDPLDGTTSFAHGHPYFSVSIGLCRGSEPLLGVVLAPALAITWHAIRGEGSFRNGERCHVSATATFEDALCATGFPGHPDNPQDDNMREFAAFNARTHGVRRCGSAAVDLAMVADGTHEIYWQRRLNAWDVAAGVLLVTEAGGRVSNHQGGDVHPRSGEFLATNGHLHAEAIWLLREQGTVP